jgi:hypothetical protein
VTHLKICACRFFLRLFLTALSRVSNSVFFKLSGERYWLTEMQAGRIVSRGKLHEPMESPPRPDYRIARTLQYSKNRPCSICSTNVAGLTQQQTSNCKLLRVEPRLCLLIGCKSDSTIHIPLFPLVLTIFVHVVCSHSEGNSIRSQNDISKASSEESCAARFDVYEKTLYTFNDRAFKNMVLIWQDVLTFKNVLRASGVAVLAPGLSLLIIPSVIVGQLFKKDISDKDEPVESNPKLDLVGRW